MIFRDRMRAWQGEVVLASLWLVRETCTPLGLRRFYQLLLARLIRKTDLFDRDYYLDSNHDVAQEKMQPLRHYVAYGDREGRQPLALFDPNFYRSRIKGQTKQVNALLHYARIGRYRRISPSPWFDVQYYLDKNKDVARSGCEPMCHYLQWGGREGRSPSSQFDGAYYLSNNPDVKAARVNPLLHYLQAGRLEGRHTRLELESVDGEEGEAISVDPINASAWAELRPPVHETVPVIDIVVPVYKDHTFTLRCLYSVLTANNRTPYELVVINDASPEPALVADLEAYAARGLFTLLNNRKNLGFVGTVNRGMALHPERDVLLLNSDTEVYNNWLDRLCAVAHAHPKNASVTPLSNNATICSYPRFLHDNPYPLETNYTELDSLTARINTDVQVEAPTGVGFCMMLRRDALSVVGLFDESTFGKGYGEENDWCQRAIALGWRNIITADTFVRHFGSASFLGEKGKRVANAMKILSKLHPSYEGAVQHFVKHDPLAPARRNLDWGRLINKGREENVLICCHNRGGGAERHVREETEQLRSQGKGVYYLRPERGQPDQMRLQHPDCRQLLNLPKFRLSAISPLASALNQLNITCIHSHGLVDFTSEAPEHLLTLAQMAKIPLHVDIHDYKVVCPRINLVDKSGFYCREPEPDACNICLRESGNDFGAVDIRQWRSLHGRVLQAAENVWVPDQDVADRLERYYPNVSCKVAPHDDVDATMAQRRIPLFSASSKKLRIVVIGAISKIKGYDVMLACAQDVKKRNLPLEFVLMGYSMNDEKLQAAGIHVAGKYEEHEAQTVFDKLLIHGVWLPALWPETFSYTLSIAMKSTLPVFAFDLGAIARRIRIYDKNYGQRLLPLETARFPKQINDCFIEYRALCIKQTNASKGGESRCI